MENDNLTLLNVAQNKLIEESILQNNGDLNLLTLLSLMSLFFKEFFKNDILVQYLEVNVLRQNAYKITNCKSLVALLEDFLIEKNDSTEKQVIEIFIKIFNDIDKYFEVQQKPNTSGLYEVIKESFVNQKQNIDIVLNILNNVEQKQMATEGKKVYTLSPTKGIAMLNNDPYSFFVSKVLNLEPIEDWNNTVSTKTHGLIVHQIMECFAKKCRNYKYNADCDMLRRVFDESLTESLVKSNMQITSFLKQKLKKIKEIAVKLELDAIKNNRSVYAEYPLQTVINGVKIYAKADRIEFDNKNKLIYIFDYKTGTIPKNADEVNGTKPQLSIIAMLILKNPEYKDFLIKKMQYIDLSGKEKIENQTIDTEEVAHVEKNIANQIETFFKNGEPIIEKMYYIKPSGSLYEDDIAVMKMYRENFILESQ